MKKIPWWQPVLGPREKELLCAVVDANFPNEGDYTEAFEKGIAAHCGSGHGVAVTSGTAALFLALKACQIGHGDEVIVPDLTFIATANAVHLAGATPVLVDVEADTFAIDVAAIE